MISFSQNQKEYQLLMADIISELLEGHKSLLISLGQSLSNQKEIDMIETVNSWDREVSKVDIDRKIEEIYQFYESSDRYGMGKALKIKTFARSILSSIFSNRYFEGLQYLKAMSNLIQSQGDLEKALYFLFRIKSIVRLLKYNLYENVQYKYDLQIQALFYYILSFLKPNQTQECVNQFKYIYFRTNYDSTHSKIIQAANVSINNPMLNCLTKDVLTQMAFKQKQVKQGRQESNGQVEEIELAIDCVQSRCSKLLKVHACLEKTKKYPHYTLILKHLQKTRLVQKGLKLRFKDSKSSGEQSSSVQERQLSSNNRSLDSCKLLGKSDTLLKYSKSTRSFIPTHVELTYDGIYLKQKQDFSSLKYQWERVKNVVYGKVIKNDYKEANIEEDLLFSVILQEGSVDFVCESQEQAAQWVSAIAQMLNRRWQEEGVAKRIRWSHQALLWKSSISKFKSSLTDSLK